MAPTITHDDIRYMGEKIIRYRPLPAPRAFHKSMAKVRWLCGGNRGGKSEATIGFDLCSFALGVHPFRRTPPGAIIWVATVSWPMVGKLLWQEKIKSFLPASQIVGIDWHIKALDIPQEIRLASGVTIELKSLEQGRELFQGRAIDAYYQDEQAPRDSEQIFQEVQARLIDRNGFAAFSMTPIIPQVWLEDRIRDLPDTDEAFFADLEDNRKSRGGFVDDAEVDALIAQWPEEIRETRIRGYFAQFAGAVYRSFNARTHVIKPFPIPLDWPKYRAIDWGFNVPFAALWLARDMDGRWHVYREHHEARQPLEYHAAKIKAASVGEQYVCTWADHDPDNCNAFRKLGIPTVPAKKDVLAGIEVVQAALKIQGDGKPRLFIFEDCRNTRREMAGYRWAEATEAKDARDEPVKKNDHALDALRYCVFSIDGDTYFAKKRRFQ